MSIEYRSSTDSHLEAQFNVVPGEGDYDNIRVDSIINQVVDSNPRRGTNVYVLEEPNGNGNVKIKFHDLQGQVRKGKFPESYMDDVVSSGETIGNPSQSQ